MKRNQKSQILEVQIEYFYMSEILKMKMKIRLTYISTMSSLQVTQNLKIVLDNLNSQMQSPNTSIPFVLKLFLMDTVHLVPHFIMSVKIALVMRNALINIKLICQLERMKTNVPEKYIFTSMNIQYNKFPNVSCVFSSNVECKKFSNQI